MSRLSFEPSSGATPPRFLDSSTARVAVMGDAHCGKTSLVLRWLSGTYRPVERGAFLEDIYHRTMLFHQFFQKHLDPDEHSAALARLDELKRYAVVDVQVLDCESGDATYDNVEVRTVQIRQSDAFIVCFDPQDRESLESLHGYVQRIRDTVGDAVIVICATKYDLNLGSGDYIDNVDEQLRSMGLSLNEDYVEVSAKTGANVNQLFCKVLTRILQHKEIIRSGYTSEQSIDPETATETTSLESAVTLTATLGSPESFHTARPSRSVIPSIEMATKEVERTKKKHSPCCVVC